MAEASKPFMAFTVGPLGFYKCDLMPFRPVNALATFQRLVETSLGDLELNWCLIYLDDIIVFSSLEDGLEMAGHLVVTVREETALSLL